MSGCSATQSDKIVRVMGRISNSIPLPTNGQPPARPGIGARGSLSYDRTSVYCCGRGNRRCQEQWRWKSRFHRTSRQPPIARRPRPPARKRRRAVFGASNSKTVTQGVLDRGQLLSIPMNNRPERMDTHALMPYPASAVRLKLLGLAEELTSDEHAAYLASAGADLVKLGVPQ